MAGVGRPESHGSVDPPAPGIQNLNVFDVAIDCDLGLRPLTNIMPIRRLELLDHDAEQVPLVMAWVEVPSLRVLRSDQFYGFAGKGESSSHLVRYTCRSRNFDAALSVDRCENEVEDDSSY